MHSTVLRYTVMGCNVLSCAAASESHLRYNEIENEIEMGLHGILIEQKRTEQSRAE